MYNHYFVGFAWAKTEAVAAAVHRNAGRIKAEISMDELPIRRPVRLGEYDYSQNGCYFVTVCTHKRQHLFEISTVDSEAYTVPSRNLSNRIIEKWLYKMESEFDVAIEQYVIMPDHIHFVLTIMEQNRCVDLPRMMQWFKTMTTNEYISNVRSRNVKPFVDKLWQKSYYEHIIRNEADYLETRQYILNNPLKWKMKHGLE